MDTKDSVETTAPSVEPAQFALTQMGRWAYRRPSWLSWKSSGSENNPGRRALSPPRQQSGRKDEPRGSKYVLAARR